MPLLSQGTNQQIKAHEASSAVQHVNLLKEWSNSLEKKVGMWLLAFVGFYHFFKLFKEEIAFYSY
jgi:hypothetical protein